MTLAITELAGYLDPAMTSQNYIPIPFAALTVSSCVDVRTVALAGTGMGADSRHKNTRYSLAERWRV